MATTKKKAVATKKKATKKKATKKKESLQTLAERLVQLKIKADEIKEKMDTIKNLILICVEQKPIQLKSDSGIVKLIVSNSWSLPPVNAAKAQEILGESFTFYFKEKLSYGVETLAKNKIKDGDDELGKKLLPLVELQQKKSWEIKPL